MTVGYLRPTRVLVNQQAIYENVQNELAQLKNQETEVFAVVKANGYGHGMVPVAQAAEAAGATGFCVAILDEALDLRRADFTEPILTLGITQPVYASLMAANQISVTVGSLAWLEEAYAILKSEKNSRPIHVHLGIDSGMGRIGFREASELLAAYQFMQTHNDYFDFEGVFTHFATADDPDDTYFKEQSARFKTLLAILPEQPRYVHVSNSATSLWHAACNGNMIRLGVSMYGLNPSGKAIEKVPYQLQPAMRVESELCFVKEVKPGSKIGYGATYTADSPEWIGTVPIGYADGWLRRMQGSQVLVDGQFCEVVGRVCMDQLMVRLPHECPVGTKVVLVGQSGQQSLSLQDIADYAGTIHYEIACDLAQRLPRVYQPITGDINI